MPERGKTYNNFDLTLDECRLILDHLDRLVVVDKDGKIKYISEDLLSLIELISQKDLSDVVGKHIDEVHPLSKISQVLETRQSQDECFYFSGGEVNVARLKPVISGDRFWGAMDYDIFKSEKDFRRFFSEVAKLSKEGFIDFGREMIDVMKNYGEIIKDFKYNVGDILGESSVIKSLRQTIYDLAESDSTVLITGETGSGKELIANSIHNVSRRARSRMVRINCAAIPENLVESELFGYEEGAFTGAQKGGKIGKFEYANGGTIFLDEIDQLPYHIQPKLLRFLQEREIDRVGGKDSISVDVRLIAATNKNLRELVNNGKFREDLYYRINVLEIKVPPLREHKEDIPILAEAAIERINSFLGKSVKGINADALEVLMLYDWPGNIRELLNIMERAMNRCHESQLTIVDFDDLFLRLSDQKIQAFADWSEHPLDHIRDMAEADAIRRTLDLTNWNISKTAKLLKTSRPAIYYKMKKYDIVR